MNARYVLTYTSSISIASNLHLHLATTTHFFIMYCMLCLSMLSYIYFSCYKTLHFLNSYKFVSKSKIHQHCILPRKYNRQRRQLLFLVCLEVSEKRGVMK
jgi:hypothetical protein